MSMDIKHEIKVQMIDWFDSRFYQLDVLINGVLEKKLIPSVTTKLGIIDKPFLAQWRGDIGNREANLRLFESEQRGTRIHHAWSVLCGGGIVIYNPWNRPTYPDRQIQELKEKNTLHAVLGFQDEMYALIKLKKLVDILKPKMNYSERTVYSLRNNDAGTVDNDWDIKEGEYLISGKKPLYIPGGRYIIDLKTGNQVSEEAYSQTACYLKCSEEMDGTKYQGTLIIHTGSKNKSGIEGLGCHLSLKEEVEKHYEIYRTASKLWEQKNQDMYPKVFQFPSLLKLN